MKKTFGKATNEMRIGIMRSLERLLGRDVDELTVRRRGDGIKIEQKRTERAETIRGG